MIEKIDHPQDIIKHMYMKHLKTFETYLIQEYSQNDPIPELNTSIKPLAIFIMGSAAAGKSYFIENFIKHRKGDIKSFSSDDVSLMFSKDPNIRHRGSGELNIKRIDSFINSGLSFIYDTTTSYSGDKVELINRARENGYDIIFIALITPYHVTVDRNKKRDRNESDDYLKHSYNTIWSNIKMHKDLNPDYFYVVTNLNNEYNFYKYIDGELKRKSGSVYK